MANDTLKVRIGLDGDKELLARLQLLGAGGERAIKQIQAAADATNQRGGFLSGISTGVAGLKAAFGVLAEGAKNIKGHFDAVTAAGDKLGGAIRHTRNDIAIFTVAIGGAATGLLLLAKNAGDAQQDIVDSSRALGLSTAAYQRFQKAAATTGVEMGTLDKLLLAFDIALTKTGETTQTAAKATDEWSSRIKAVPGAISPGLEAARAFAGAFAKTGEAAKKAGADILAGLTGTPEQKLEEFRLRIAAIPTALGKISALTATGIFNKRTALEAINFLDQLGEKALTVLGPIPDALLAQGEAMGKAIRAVGLDLTTLKNEFLDSFSEPIRVVAADIQAFLAANQKSILAFAQGLADKVGPILADITTLIGGGGDDLVQTKGLLEFRDAVIAIGEAVKTAFTEIIIPAFRAVHAVADVLAAAINNIFGTKITADALLVAVAVGTVTGAFTLLFAAMGLVVALIGAFTAPWVILVGLLTTVGVLIAALFGKEIVSAISTSVTAVVGFLGRMLDAIRGFGDDIEKLFESVTGKIHAALDAVDGAIKGGFSASITFVVGLFNDLVSVAGTVGTAIGGVFTSIGTAIESAIEGAVSFVTDKFNGLVSFAQSIASTISGIISSILSALSGAQAKAGTPGGARTLARGGIALGPGTGTSDDILAWLSNGEGVITAAGVQKYGAGMIHLLNSLRLPKDFFRGFSLGGLADGINRSLAIPTFSMGGLATAGPAAPAAMHTLNLTIGGETFHGLLAPEDTAASIMRFAAKRNIRRAGGRPSWAGS